MSQLRLYLSPSILSGLLKSKHSIHIIESAYKAGRVSLGVIELLAYPKICDFNLPFGVDQNVFWLYISMDLVFLFMNVIQTLQNLNKTIFTQ